MNGSLHGVHVLVTRPREQGEGLCRRIVALGGRATLWPAMEIEAVADPGAEAAAQGLDRQAIVIFTSRTAGRC